MKTLVAVNSKTTLAALCAMMVVSLGTLQIQPLLGGALVDQLGIPLNALGTLFAGELLAMAVACGLSAMLMPKVNRRTFARIALVSLVLGNLASIEAGSWLTLIGCRLICGLSGGAVMAVVYATAAMRRSKDAGFALINMGNLAWGMLLVSSTPLVLQQSGVSGTFLILALASACALLGSGRIPPHFVDGPGHSRVWAPPLSLTAVLLVSLFALLFFGHSALWVYQERIGKSIGLAPEQIGAILGASILAGALGAGLAALIKRRLGLLLPQLIGFGAALFATLIMVQGSSPLAFAVTAALIHLVWFFSLPYLLSMTAELDPSGRLAGLGNAAIFIGQGLGPFGAALVVGEGNFRAVGWLAASVYLAALIIACVVVARIRRHPAALTGSQPSQPARA